MEWKHSTQTLHTALITLQFFFLRYNKMASFWQRLKEITCWTKRVTLTEQHLLSFVTYFKWSSCLTRLLPTSFRFLEQTNKTKQNSFSEKMHNQNKYSSYNLLWKKQLLLVLNNLDHHYLKVLSNHCEQAELTTTDYSHKDLLKWSSHLKKKK